MWTCRPRMAPAHPNGIWISIASGLTFPWRGCRSLKPSGVAICPVSQRSQICGTSRRDVASIISAPTNHMCLMAPKGSIQRRNMPGIPTISNLWDFAPRRGFDYLSTYKSYVSYGAEGFYPSDPVSGSFQALMEKGDLSTPIWFNEFTAGGGGWYGEPGRSRMYAQLALMIGAQGVLAWTFNSHLGGEEQALFGLLDHDNTPSWKVDEFAHIASDYRLLSKYGFPRYTHPQVAIAYSFESSVDSNPNGPSSTTRQYFKTPYSDQVRGAFEPFFRENIDAAIINIGHDSLASYKLVVVPADYVIDRKSTRLN